MKAECNLHIVTTHVLMEDGIPKVCIPRHVLLEGLENKKEYVVGQFHRCSAPFRGQIHAVATQIWGRKCRIFTPKLGESSYVFNTPDESTRNWVINKGLWHIDDCLMFVSAWTPSETITLPEITTIPICLTLKNIPNQIYSFKGIDWIASGIGEPMLSNKPWLDPTLMGEAKILVEVKLNKQFPQRVAVEDESGSISMVDVVYSWIPSKCATCGQLGHKASRCVGLPHSQSALGAVAASVTITSTVIICKNLASDPTIHETASIGATNAALEATTISGIASHATIATATQPAALTVIGTKSETASSMEASTVSKTESMKDDFIILSSSVIVLEEKDQGKSSPPPLMDLDASTTISMNENQGENEEGVQGDNQFALLEIREEASEQDVENAFAQRSRGGRPIKPTQKIQEMQWNLVVGRGSRGQGCPGGRGSTN